MKCPICGNPVPPSKGDKPRKYCSRKCSLRASYLAAKRRGCNRRRKKFRKICVICGRAFFAERDKQKCCSSSCGSSLGAIARGRRSRKLIRARIFAEAEKRHALERCRETAPITVEVRGNVRTEWRGTRVIGAHAADHI